MATNPVIAKKESERLAADLDKYIGKGKSIEQLGFKMKKEGIPMGIGRGCLASKEKLPPSFTRESYN